MKRIISFLVFAVMLVSCFNCFAADITIAEKTILYVATDGNDKNDGSESRPLASLEGARDKLRELKKNGELAKDGAVVYFKAGEYGISDTLKFEAQDSGTATQPIVYRAYGDGEVSFAGGIYIPYSKFTKTTDSKILNQLIEESAKSRVKQVDLRALGYTGKLPYNADMTRENEYVPEKRLTIPFEIYVGDTTLNLARYPNTGWMGMKTLVKMCQDVDYWLERKYTDSRFIPKEQRDPTDQLIFVPDDNRFLLWPEDSGNGIIKGPLSAAWYSNEAMFTVDKQKKQIATKYPLLYISEVGPGNSTFYVVNLLCELDADYEYWVDEKGVLYCILPDSAKDEKIFMTTTDQPLISLESGCEYLTFRGLSFDKAKGNSLTMQEGSANNLVYDCHNANNAGMVIQGTNNGVKNSYFLGGKGVEVYGGDVEKLVSAENYVENCEFDANSADTVPLRIVSGVGNRISYNEVHNGSAGLIEVFGKKHIVEYNDVYDGMQYTADAGLIYGTGLGKGGVCERGNIFRYNYLHDSYSNVPIKSGNSCIYTDDGSAGNLIVGNIMSNINEGEGRGIHLGGSSDTIIDNNIFIKLKQGIFFDDRASWATFNNPDNSVIINNLEVTNKGYFRNEYWREEFPELYERFKEINTETFDEAWNCRKTNNIYWNVQGDSIANSYKYLVNENNYTTTTDPGFLDADNGNFILSEDSDVFKKIEFMQIPTTRIGRYSVRAITRIEDAVVLKDNSPYSYVDGEMQLIGEDTSVTPIYVGDSIYIPLRFVSEGMNAKVEWNDETSSASITTAEGKAVTFTIGSNEAVLDGQSTELNNAPLLYKGKTYIPIRAFSELVGYTVFWDDCGLICVSTDDRFNPEADKNIITYLADELNIY